MTAQIICGDCLDVMREMEAGSVDAIVTDPPYGLSFASAAWDKGVPGSAYWIEALRVAKPGAHLLAFGGTRTYHHLACAIEDAGWEIRDCLCWLYGSGMPKPGKTLKPAWEPVIVGRRPFKGTVAANISKHGTGEYNIDGCRVDTNGEEIIRVGMLNDMRGGNYGNSVGKQRTDIGIVTRATPRGGRWPANLIHDGTDEVIGLFPNSGANGKGWNVSSKSYGRSPTTPMCSLVHNVPFSYGDPGSAARFFYCAKASRSERGDGNDHPTVKPLALMRYLCRLVTPQGGLVLDPFAGSGTTGVAAILEGMDFIGIERDPEYAEIARKRIDAQQRTPALSTYLEEVEA